MATQVIKTDCILCVWGCGINAYTEDGKLVKVEGMAEHPLNKGVICPRAEHLPEYVYSSDRLKYPMKKVGGKWKRISWDKAIDTIAIELAKIKEKYGAKALAVYSGSIGVENIELAAFAQRFRGAFGTPNLLSVEGNCFRSRIMARQLTFGSYLIEEPENAKCIILWAHNPDSSRMPTQAAQLHKALDIGKVKLIVIDPKRTPLAKKGIHIPIRPGTDCALALGMLNVIISEGLYDKEFIKKYTIGFDKLVEHVKQYPPKKVEKITWVPAEEIEKIARIFATTKPAAIVQGTCCLDQQISGLQNNRVLSILQTVTGNINIPGSWVSVPFIRLSDLRLMEISEPIGAETYQMFHRFWGRISPYGQEMLFANAVLNGNPYPIRALIVTGGNPALTLPDSERIQKAMKSLDFMVVMDMFMTETANLADIVLPACSFMERSGIGYVYGVTSALPYALVRKKVIEPLNESWPDWKFWTDLGRKMGYGEFFPWQTEEEVISFLLKPSGLTMEQLIKRNPEGAYYAQKKYEMGTLRTPSGKIEIYSETLRENGYDPLPVHIEPTRGPVSSPELAKKYPLILTTGARILEYTHSQFRNVPGLRKLSPEPEAEINPVTAKKYGIKDGDLMCVETVKGSINIKAKTTEDLSTGIVSIPHGWAKANVNLLTELDLQDPITGYAEVKVLLCRVSRVA